MSAEEEPKNGNGTHDDPMVVEVKGRNNLTGAQITKLLLIGIVIAVLIPTSVTVALFVIDSNDEKAAQERRSNENRELILRVDALRLLGDQRAYEQCVAAEARDRVVTAWGLQFLKITRRLPGQTDRDILDLVEALEDGIADLEPVDEKPCVPPKEVKP